MTSPYPSPAPRRLERSRSNRVLGGVCGGVATYLNMDPTLVRVLTVVLSLFTGVPVIVYLVLLLVVPEEGSDMPPNVPPGYAGGASQTIPSAQPPARPPAIRSGGPAVLRGSSRRPLSQHLLSLHQAHHRFHLHHPSSGKNLTKSSVQTAILVRDLLTAARRRARVRESSGAPGDHLSSPGGSL